MSKDAMTDAMTGDVYPYENSIYDRLDKLTQRIAAMADALAKQRAVNVAVREWITESAEQQDITVAGPKLLAVLHALGEAIG